MPRFLIDIKTQVRISKADKQEMARSLIKSVIERQGMPDNIFILDFEQPEKTGIKNIYNIRIPADIKIENELKEKVLIQELNTLWSHPMIRIIGIDILGEIEDYD